MGFAASLIGLLKPVRVTVSHLFRKPTTVMYPHAHRPPTDRFRGGTFGLTTDPETGLENCIGCRLCEMICPSKIITVTLDRRPDRGYAGIFTLQYEACMQCELCVQVCPTDAIVMSREFGEPAYSRADFFLDKEKLHANGKKMGRVWGSGSTLQAMHGKKERPAPAAAPPATPPAAPVAKKEGA